LFEEKPKERNIVKHKIDQYGIEICDIQNIKNGKDWESSDGKIIPNMELTTDPPEPLKYAFCSDTGFYPKLETFFKSVDLLYHESTFLQEDEKLAKKTKHSTAAQAGQIAALTQTKNLLIGHYSVRYLNKEMFKNEASKFFPNVFLGSDLLKIEVNKLGVELLEI